MKISTIILTFMLSLVTTLSFGQFCDQAQAGPGFPSAPSCEAAICASDSYCCTTQWDGICASAAATEPNCVSCLSTAPPVPANDLCSNAIAMTCGTSVDGTTVNATIDTDQSTNCGTSITAPGVWYTITGTGEMMQANTCTNLTYDTKLSVFTGSCGALTCVTGNDDNCGLGSAVSWASTAGTTYYILVHGFSSGTGTFTLNAGSTMTNQICATATTITAGTVSGSTICTGNDVQGFCGTSDGSGGGVWYAYTSPTCINVNATTCGLAAFDTKIRVFTGSCAALSCVTGNDDACGLQSTVNWTANAGVTYYILVHGWSSSEGAFSMTLSESAYTDVVAPVANTATLADVTAECEVTSLTAPTATDNCAGTITGTTTTTLPITTQGTTVITWTYNDGNGNTSTQTQNVVIDDVTGPAMTCPANITVNNDLGVCGAVVTFATPTAVDNCSASGQNILFVSDNATATEIPAALTTAGYTVTTVLNDYVAGNNATLQGSLSSYDAIYWHASGASGFGEVHNLATMTNLNSFVAAGGNVFVTGYDVIASPTDLDLITFLGGTGSVDVPPGGGQGTILGPPNSLNSGYTDIIGLVLNNPGDHDALTGLAPSVTVVAPNGSGADWSLNNTGGGDIAWVSSGQTGAFALWTTPGSGYHEALLNFAYTNLGAPTTVAQTDVTGLSSGDVFPVGTTTIEFTGTDPNGNTTVCSFTVTVNDTEAPVANATTLADVTAECEVASLTAPTATDNCAGTITATTATVFPITTQGTTVVTWTYNDGNGNTSTQTQNVIIDDVTAPVADAATLADVTAECEVTSLTAPTATDNCAGMVMVSHDATLPITTQGTTVVTWTYEDMNGNSSTQTQNVVIEDVTGPVADAATLADVTAECEVTSLTEPTATDNCGTVTVTNDAVLPITAQGTTVVTWTYEDQNGNTTTQTQNVVIEDVTGPVADVATLADVTAECEVTSLTEPTATDNCGGMVMVSNDAVLPITAQGTTVVTWTYEDENGNTSTQTQNVVIEDVTAPLADVATLADVTATCEVTSLTEPTATDNCGGTVTVSNDAVFPITADVTVTWTYEDENGNTSTQTQEVLISAVDATVTVAGATITANNTNTGVTYQWVDCDNGNAPISGATGVSYTATANGNYAVEVTEGNCTETSACTLIDLSNVNELTADLIKVYPNPASSVLNIETASEGTVGFYDVSGKLISTQNVIAGSNQMNVDLLATGTYTLRLTTANGIQTVRLVITK